jgi:iron complex outermembrane receptor protein
MRLAVTPPTGVDDVHAGQAARLAVGARRYSDGLKRLAHRGAGGVVLCALFAAGAGHADPAVGRSMQAMVTFSIPAQPLSSALMSLGKQANVQILTASDSIAGLRCSGASGTLSVEAALGRLLAGTDLEYETFDAQTVVVRQRSFVPAGSFESQLRGAAPTMPILTSLSTIQVAGVALGDLGYKADATRSATRSDTALADIPQSVSIITRDLMDSQQAVSVSDVVRNVAGVNYVDGFGGPPLFRIRGFNVGNGMTDGLPNGVARVEDLPPLIGIERVEVLKGPEAILGESSVDNNFGGSVNIVMKQPQAEPVHEVSFSLGQYDGARAGFDFAGPLDTRGAWTYRWIASANYSDRSAQGYDGQRSGYLAPSIAWQGSTTRVTFGLEYVNNRIPVADHSVLLGDSLDTATPFGILLGNADDHTLFRTTRAVYRVEQMLDETWSFESRGQYVDQRSSGQGWAFLNATLPGDVDALAQSFNYSDAFYTLQNDLAGSFSQGDITHRVLLGVDYSRTREGNGDDPSVIKASQPLALNVYSSFALPTARSQTVNAATVQSLGGAWSTQTGIFLQDQIAFGSDWSVLAALRRTSYDLLARDSDGTQRLKKSRWVPKFGVVYKPRDNVSLYASTATGFQTDSMIGQNGQPLPPAVSRQIEVGTKVDLFDQRVTWTTALYRITLDHSIDTVSPTPPYFAVPGPGQTNKGFETELTGQLARGLDATASFTDARIHNDDDSVVIGSPQRQGSVWLSYRFQHQPLQGWGVAGGIFARSRYTGRTGDGFSYFDIPGQASAEANVSYTAGNWRATFGVKNLFARTLYAVDVYQNFVPIREGRVWMFSSVYDF